MVWITEQSVIGQRESGLNHVFEALGIRYIAYNA
jgi:hypothetical protein